VSRPSSPMNATTRHRFSDPEKCFHFFEYLAAPQPMVQYVAVEALIDPNFSGESQDLHGRRHRGRPRAIQVSTNWTSSAPTSRESERHSPDAWNGGFCPFALQSRSSRTLARPFHEG
jgi:hypothetical protein